MNGKQATNIFSDLTIARDVQLFLIEHDLELHMLFDINSYADRFQVRKKGFPLSYNFQVLRERTRDDISYQCDVFREVVKASEEFDFLLKGENDG